MLNALCFSTRRPLEDTNVPATKIDKDMKQLQHTSEQVVRIQSKTRRKRSPRTSPRTLSNRFTSIAPIWFYSLVAGFMAHKENEALWSGSTGSQFLANLFRTLSIIVEFSGIYGSPQVMAKDLFELVWSFRDADVAEIRLSVLVAVATSIAMLPEERMLALLMEGGDSLPRIMSDMSSRDPDKNCRSLALTISQSLVEVLDQSMTLR
jgi:hypothetical protein